MSLASFAHGVHVQGRNDLGSSGITHIYHGAPVVEPRAVKQLPNGDERTQVNPEEKQMLGVQKHRCA